MWKLRSVFSQENIILLLQLRGFLNFAYKAVLLTAIVNALLVVDTTHLLNSLNTTTY